MVVDLPTCARECGRRASWAYRDGEHFCCHQHYRELDLDIQSEYSRLPLAPGDVTRDSATEALLDEVAALALADVKGGVSMRAADGMPEGLEGVHWYYEECFEGARSQSVAN
jgi:hypothetical protein